MTQISDKSELLGVCFRLMETKQPNKRYSGKVETLQFRAKESLRCRNKFYITALMLLYQKTL